MYYRTKHLTLLLISSSPYILYFHVFVYYFHYKRIDLCVNETITFNNNGSCPICISWISNKDSGRASVRVEPESFEISNELVEVVVRISPKFSGWLREILRFRTENLDGSIGEATVYIRGIVEPMPEVNFQPAIAPLSPICAGTLESYDVKFDVKFSGLFDVHRRIYELGDHGILSSLDNWQSFDSFKTGITGEVALTFETPLKTQVNRMQIVYQLENLN